MAYRINYRQALIEVDTETEFRLVMEVIGLIDIQVPLPIDGQGNQRNGASPFRAMVRRAKAPQRRLLDALAQADWISDSQLRPLLGIETNLQLAGMWLGVVKNAQHNGLTRDQVFQKRHQRTGNDAGYWYRMTDEARAAIRQN